MNDVVVLFVSGDPSRADAILGSTAAAFSGLRVVILTGVPNQPLFGLREDALIAYTFERYLAEGDPDWPLLLPMVRSAHAAMEALEALAPELWGTELRGFVVTGASKRGWTTYLAAATAPEKVLGIAPIVFDFLNFPLQLAAQTEALGGPSPMLEDYTGRGLTGVFEASPRRRGSPGLWIPTPTATPSRCPSSSSWAQTTPTGPWTRQALLARDPDPKLLLVVPNAGHGVLDFTRVIGSVAAFARAVAQGTPLPVVDSQLRFRADGAVLAVRADREPVEARLWAAEPDPGLPGGPVGRRGAPRRGRNLGGAARSASDWVPGVLRRARLHRGGLRLYVSTPTRVLGP